MTTFTMIDDDDDNDDDDNDHDDIIPHQASCMQCCPSSSVVAVGSLTGHIFFVEMTNVEKPRLIYRSHLHNGPVLQLRYAKEDSVLLIN